MVIIQFMPEFGLAGAETMCENLSTELYRKGHKVYAVSLYNYKSPITSRLEKNNVTVIYLNKKPGLDLSIIGKIRFILKKYKPDVVHTHRYVAQYVIPATWGLGIKHKIHTVHNIAKEENTTAARMLNKFFFKYCGLVPVALTKLIQGSIEKEYGLPKERIPVIFNGVSLNKCNPITLYRKEVLNILHIGRYSQQKNHIEMLKAFLSIHSKYPNIKLHLLGDGPLKQEIANLINSSDAESFIIEHGLSDNPYEYLSDSDLFMLPSKYEGMPMTLIEAMGTGLPIVASDVGGIPDMIKDGVSGILCKPSEKSIASALDRVIQSETLREKIGKTALQESLKFSAQTMCERYLDVYSMV